MSCKHPTLKTIYRSSLKRGLIYVANLLNLFHIITLFNKNNLPNKKHPKNHQKNHSQKHLEKYNKPPLKLPYLTATLFIG